VRRVLSLVLLTAGMAAGRASSDEPKGLARLTVPDDKAAATKAVQGWLEARGFDCENRGDILTFKRGGVLFNIRPLVIEQGLDRLLVSTIYYPKDEYKGSKELAELAAEQNRAQNFLQVYIRSDGVFGASSNLTFYDELTAHEFDTFLDFYTGVLRQYILTQEALKMLK
jgi:hypothetical protein